MAIARFLDRMCLALWVSGLWLRYAAKFAIWQPCQQGLRRRGRRRRRWWWRRGDERRGEQVAVLRAPPLLLKEVEKKQEAKVQISPAPGMYRAEKKGLYAVARYFFLALLSLSALPCLAVA